MSEKNGNQIPAPSFSIHPREPLIPAALIGNYRGAKRRWGKIVSRAIESGSWEDAFEGARFVHINEAPGDIIIEGPSPSLRGDNVMAIVVGEVLSRQVNVEKFGSLARVTEKKAALYTKGIEHFCFALAALTVCFGISPVETPVVRRRFAMPVVDRLIDWWPDLYAVESRYAIDTECRLQWPSWFCNAMPLLGDGGLKECELYHLAGITDNRETAVPRFLRESLRQANADYDQP